MQNFFNQIINKLAFIETLDLINDIRWLLKWKTFKVCMRRVCAAPPLDQIINNRYITFNNLKFKKESSYYVSHDDHYQCYIGIKKRDKKFWVCYHYQDGETIGNMKKIIPVDLLFEESKVSLDNCQIIGKPIKDHTELCQVYPLDTQIIFY